MTAPRHGLDGVGAVRAWLYPLPRDPLALVAELVARRAGCEGVDAVRAFQAAHGLVADGLVGPATARALGVDALAGVVWGRS